MQIELWNLMLNFQTVVPLVQPRDPREPPPPPPTPPKARAAKLPPNWKTAKDKDNKTYYYHTLTR